MIIYKLTFPNGKSYIGQTVRNMDIRLSQHRTAARAGSLLPVHCAWRKHGEPAVAVVSTHKDMASLHAAERAQIIACGTLAPGGYNVGYGGETAPSKNPAVAAKIAAKASGRIAGDGAKARIAAASTANWKNPEYREKVSAAVKASWTPEMRQAASERGRARMTGNVHSDETRARIASKARNMSAETRAKMSASAKARARQPMSPTLKAKLSASIKASHNGVGRGAAISAALKARSENMTPEQRQTLTEIRKRGWVTRRAKSEGRPV